MPKRWAPKVRHCRFENGTQVLGSRDCRGAVGRSFHPPNCWMDHQQNAGNQANLWMGVGGLNWSAEGRLRQGDHLVELNLPLLKHR